MKLSFDQRKILSEFPANLGVAWFAGGIVAPILTLKKISDIYFPGIRGLALTIVSISFSLLILRKR